MADGRNYETNSGRIDTTKDTKGTESTERTQTAGDREPDVSEDYETNSDGPARTRDQTSEIRRRKATVRRSTKRTQSYPLAWETGSPAHRLTGSPVRYETNSSVAECDMDGWDMAVGSRYETNSGRSELPMASRAMGFRPAGSALRTPNSAFRTTLPYETNSRQS